MVLALAVAWFSFPETGEVPEVAPLAAATPPDPSLPAPVARPPRPRVAERPAEAPPEPEPEAAQRDTGAPAVLELVMPLGEGCEGMRENSERLRVLLEDVQSVQGPGRQHILRQLGPLMQSLEVEGCEPPQDFRPDVTRVLCDELRDRPDDMELLLVAGFAEISCE